MESRLLILPVIFLLLQQAYSFKLIAIEKNEFNVSACFNQTEKELHAECAEGFQVKIDHVIYGHSNHGGCSIAPGDCTQEDLQSLSCIGQRSCPTNLPSGDRGRMLPQCGLYSTYMQIQYSCIEDTDTTNICARDLLTEQRGYISTPRYPNNYPSPLTCEVTIEVHPSQHLTLFSMDFDLEEAPNSGCTDSLHMQSPTHDATMCGRRYNTQLIKTLDNTLTLTFRSLGQGQSKGFWLYYEASPFMPPTTTSSTTEQETTVVPSVAMTDNGKTSTVLPSIGQHTIRSTTVSSTTPGGDDKPSARLPLEAIVGGVLGTLLFILFTLLILLIIKRRKERDMNASPSTCYLNSKQSASKHGTSGPYIQNNLYSTDDSKLFSKV